MTYYYDSMKKKGMNFLKKNYIFYNEDIRLQKRYYLRKLLKAIKSQDEELSTKLNVVKIFCSRR